MNEIFGREEKKKGVNKIFIAGLVIGLVIIGVIIWVISLRPSFEDQQQQILAGAYREGTPQFAELTKDIIIATDDRTVESPTGMGTISMYITGNIRNKGTKTITILEVNVGVIDQQNQVLRERRMLVVPVQQPRIGPDETIPITITIDGFDRKADRANIRWKVTAIKAE
jgi:hypothetical protein